MSRLTRDGTAETISRDQIFRRERRQGNMNFPCSADHEQVWQPCPVDSYCYKCDHTQDSRGGELPIPTVACIKEYRLGMRLANTAAHNTKTKYTQTRKHVNHYNHPIMGSSPPYSFPRRRPSTRERPSTNSGLIWPHTCTYMAWGAYHLVRGFSSPE